MKNIFLLFFSFITIHSIAQLKDDEMIRQVVTDQTLAWNYGDIDSFMQGYWKNDSLMFIGKNGITYGWANILNNYKKGYPDTAAMGKLSFTIISLKRLSSEYFHVIGNWHLQRSIGDIGGHFTLLFRKVKGRWVIIADHSS